MFLRLQRFLLRTIQFERSLMTLLDDTNRRMDEIEGRNAQEEMEEDAVPQESEFDEAEAESAPLPENDDDDDGESWPYEAEWAPLPNDENEEPAVQVAPMEMSGTEEPVESIRELVLLFQENKDDRNPGPRHSAGVGCGSTGTIRPADLGDLPEQLRRELQVPQAVPYTVHHEGEINRIVCGICNRQFETLKGWRIHASRMHKQDGKHI
ncbi:unnamed protein product [Brugia pahangi]|uniref:C2H2-type domain-containing protein n=1 Tax=Brugia pahangi TaxID=6280 RepID=A0A0N4THH3_BRUPA|nr:unnamed protein product [Brugia pahangi]